MPNSTTISKMCRLGVQGAAAQLNRSRLNRSGLNRSGPLRQSQENLYSQRKTAVSPAFERLYKDGSDKWPPETSHVATCRRGHSTLPWFHPLALFSAITIDRGGTGQASEDRRLSALRSALAAPVAHSVFCVEATGARGWTVLGRRFCSRHEPADAGSAEALPRVPTAGSLQSLTHRRGVGGVARWEQKRRARCP